MKVLVTGGGTGGHIYPAISIAKKLQNSYKDDIEILYIGTDKGLESELVPKSGINFKTITVSGFNRKISLDTIKTIRNLLYGIKESRKIIKEFKPDFVIGTGGYVCGPIVLVAALSNIKCAIHEQNVIPGITNKILSRFVDRVFISFQDSLDYFNRNKNKVIFTGNPIREDFLNLSKHNRRATVDENEKTFRIFTFGGSRGAKRINETIKEVIKEMNFIKDISFTHITGKYYYEDFISSIKDLNLNPNIEILPYVHDMPSAMSSADLIISRSGAITLAEITAMGIPSILIPSPNVANNHQEYNARVMEKQGASIVLLEKDLDSNKLSNLLIELKNDRAKLKKMEINSKKIGIPEATDNIVKNIEIMINL